MCHWQCEPHSTYSNVQLETPSLRKELSHLWPRRGRDLCVQWNHLKLIVFYYHFVPAIYSAVHCIETEEDALALSLSVAHILIQLCASLCTVSLCEHVYPFVFGHSVHVSWFGPLHLNASVLGQWRIISEVPRCVGWMVAVEGWDSLAVTVTSPQRLWLVSRSEVRPRGEDWKDSKTSNLGDLMHRVPDDCNILQLSFTISLLPQCAVYTHTVPSLFQAIFLLALIC